MYALWSNEARYTQNGMVQAARGSMALMVDASDCV